MKKPMQATFAEAGLPNFESTNWFGVLAPAGTPRNIIDKLAGELTKIQGIHDVKEKLSSQGVDPYPGTPDQFAALIKSDPAKFAKIVGSANSSGALISRSRIREAFSGRQE